MTQLRTGSRLEYLASKNTAATFLESIHRTPGSLTSMARNFTFQVVCDSTTTLKAL